MKAARAPRDDKRKVRLLVVQGDEFEDSSIERLPAHLRRGDLLVVNDAATLPAALKARDVEDNPVEVRLRMPLGERAWQAVIFGAGDWRTPTEDRPAPRRLGRGEELVFNGGFRARVINESELSERLIDLEFNLSGADLWRNIYRHGKPIQYSYMSDEVKLWSVQNVYGSRPWAVEMASAGHAFDLRLLLDLMREGIGVAALTHGAGLSATGDERIDRALPLIERFEIPPATMEAVLQTRKKGGRVIAVGTSVVRALESAGPELAGLTSLKIGAGHKLRLVDGLLTGTHEVSESHYQLMGAFLSRSVMASVSERLERREYLTHEFGDLCLILPAGERVARE